MLTNAGSIRPSRERGDEVVEVEPVRAAASSGPLVRYSCAVFNEAMSDDDERQQRRRRSR